MAAKELKVIEAQIGEIANHERVTKVLIAQTVLDVVEHLHEHGQQALCNKLLGALTPANAKAVTKFYKVFTGFAVSKDDGVGKKVAAIKEGDVVKKDHYADCRIAFEQFKADGGNFWLWWAAQNKMPKPEAGTPLDLVKVTKTVKGFAEKAKKQGIGNVALFNAIVGEVFSPEDLLGLLDRVVALDASKKNEEARPATGAVRVTT